MMKWFFYAFVLAGFAILVWAWFVGWEVQSPQPDDLIIPESVKTFPLEKFYQNYEGKG